MTTQCVKKVPHGRGGQGAYFVRCAVVYMQDAVSNDGSCGKDNIGHVTFSFVGGLRFENGLRHTGNDPSWVFQVYSSGPVVTPQLNTAPASQCCSGFGSNTGFSG